MADMAGAVGERWVVPAPTGRSAGDHVCWPFRDRGELAAVARAFVAEGLGRDERVAYVGQGRPRELRDDLAGLANLQDCLDRGQLQVTDIAAMPASDPVADPVDELDDLAAMTRDSLDAGYTGLRIVANGTLRVLNRRRRDRIVRYEHLIDRFCLDHAFTRLCAFDATALGADVLAELGCVHTLTYGELSPFQLCAARGVDAALVGSVDAFSIAQLLEALGRIGVPRSGGRAVLDAAELEFIDVSGPAGSGWPRRRRRRHPGAALATELRLAADGVAGRARHAGGAGGAAGAADMRAAPCRSGALPGSCEPCPGLPGSTVGTRRVARQHRCRHDARSPLNPPPITTEPGTVRGPT